MPRTGTEPAARRPGRPKLQIDLDAVAHAAAALFAEVGYDGMSIEAVAERLSVSRATLYRTVASKDELLVILFERSTQDLHREASALVASVDDPRDQLVKLIHVQVGAAVRMRRYIAVFFGGAGLSTEAYARWHVWTREYEGIWAGVVERAMDAGVLEKGDPLVATRLILGMLNWVSRWYRTSENLTPDEIAEASIQLLLPVRR